MNSFITQAHKSTLKSYFCKNLCCMFCKWTKFEVPLKTYYFLQRNIQVESFYKLSKLNDHNSIFSKKLCFWFFNWTQFEAPLKTYYFLQRNMQVDVSLWTRLIKRSTLNPFFCQKAILSVLQINKIWSSIIKCSSLIVLQIK